MTSQLEKNNFSLENEKHTPNTIKPKVKRPNIDHLIKRIIDEKRQERKKTIALTLVILSVFLTFIYFGNK